MRLRLAEFSLSLHPDKTKLIEFGRFAAERREQRGQDKPETFTFLGFVLICGKSSSGRFLVLRKTRRDRMRATLKRVKGELRRRMHQPIPEQGRWLRQVVTGFFAYHAVPTNSRALTAFPPPRIGPLEARALAAQPESSHAVAADVAPRQRLAPTQPRPASVAQPALRRQTPKVGAECLNRACSDLSGGRAAMRVPTANLSHTFN